MNAPEYWWILSMSAGSLYVLLASTGYQYSIFARIRITQGWPQPVKMGIYYLYLPLLLALCALSLSDWLTLQSFPVWLVNLEEFGKLIGIVLSLQAAYFLMHGKVFGGWILLLVSTLTLQLWLYYQALGIDFRSLGQAYAMAILIVLVTINFALHAIDARIKSTFAKPLASLVLITQWVFSTTAVSPNTLAGLYWLTLESTLIPIGLMLLLVLIGYAWQGWMSRGSRQGST